MPQLDRRLLILGAGALALAGCGQGGGAGGQAATGDMSLGNADAPVKVVEYASLTCGHCAVFHEQVFPEFRAKYIDTGKVHFTFREFLTAPANVAAGGFLLARCAGQERYFDVISAIFRNQQEMLTSGPRNVLLRVAQSAGINEAEFEKCVSDRQAREALNARVEQAIKSGVQYTPTFFVNGKKVKEGVMTLPELEAAVAAAGQ